MRTLQDEAEFAKFLLEIGDGVNPSADKDMPEFIDLPTSIITETDIITEIYGKDIASSCSNDFTNCAILAPKNEYCNEINDKIVELLPGDSKTYFSVNRLIAEEEREALNFPLEFLDSLDLSGLPPHKLTL